MDHCEDSENLLDDWVYTEESVRAEDVEELMRLLALPFPGEPDSDFRSL